MRSLIILTVLATLMLSYLVSACSPQATQRIPCHHDKLKYTCEKQLHWSEISETVSSRLEATLSSGSERKLQSSSSSNYQSIRMVADFSLLDPAMNEDMKSYVSNELLPAAMNYYTQALQVIRLTKNLTTAYSSICNLPTPKQFLGNTSIAADLGIIVDSGYDDTNYIADAKACVLSYVNNRPVFGNIHYNLNFLKINNEMQRDQNLLVTIHEMAHVLGISQGLYPYFWNITNNRVQTGHVTTQNINGISTTIINLNPLTQKLQTYFGCSSIKGAILENEGQAEQSASSHFERRIFFHELMTASFMEDFRISEFTLAFLEGTGWYKGNYAMCEPLYWGKNKGCSFYFGSCYNSATNMPNFEEFCSHLTEVGCNADRHYGASCGSSSITTGNPASSAYNYWSNNTVVNDIYADNCPYFSDSDVKDCWNVNQAGRALISGEKFGLSSRCFTGNIFTEAARSSKATYCIQSSCQKNADNTYKMLLTLGSTQVTCTQAGQITVPGYAGTLDCPDPNAFCSTYGKDYCPKGCTGRGECLNGVCQCDEGWGGKDCSTEVYKAKCTKCIDDPLSKFCYGDGCGCAANDRGCLCAAGLGPCPVLDTSDTDIDNNVVLSGGNGGSNGVTTAKGKSTKNNNSTSSASLMSSCVSAVLVMISFLVVFA